MSEPRLAQDSGVKRLKEEDDGAIVGVEAESDAEYGEQEIESELGIGEQDSDSDSDRESTLLEREEEGLGEFDVADNDAYTSDESDPEVPDIAASVAFTTPALQPLSADEQQLQKDIDTMRHFWNCLPDSFLRLNLHPRAKLHPGSEKMRSLAFKDWGRGMKRELAALARYVDAEDAEYYIEEAFEERKGLKDWLVEANVREAIGRAETAGHEEREIRTERNFTFLGDFIPGGERNGRERW